MKVLIVCTGNTCRSPMAEGILKTLAATKRENSPEAPQIEVHSAGTGALSGHPATAAAIEVCREAKIDIRHHLAQRLEPDLIEESDLVLTMEDHHRAVAVVLDQRAIDRIHNLVDFAGETDIDGVADPIGGSVDQYRATFIQITDMLQRSLEKIQSFAGGIPKNQD